MSTAKVDLKSGTLTYTLDGKKVVYRPDDQKPQKRRAKGKSK